MAHTATASVPAADLPATDRRAAPRARVTYRTLVTCGSQELAAFSTDVSITGCFLETTQELDLGAVAHLSFTVSRGNERHPVEADAVVIRRVSPEQARDTGGLPGIGVAFTRFLWGGEAFAAALGDLLQAAAATPLLRRGLPRVDVGIPIYWGHGGGHREAGVLANLSASGAFFIESQATVTRGARLNLWFEVPVEGRARPVKAVARVMRVVGDGDAGTTGMAITLEVSPFDHRTLAAFLDRRLTAPIPLPPPPDVLHPTRLDELFAAAAAEWEAKGLAAVGGVEDSQAPADAAPGEPPQAREPRQRRSAEDGDATQVAAFPVRLVQLPAAEPTVRWSRVAIAAVKASGVIVAALTAIFVAALLQLV